MAIKYLPLKSDCQMLVWYCREGSFSWHILCFTLYALSFEHLWMACWRSGNTVSRPLFWWCIRVFPFVYFNSILKFWHPEEQMQQRAISYLIRGAFRVTTDGKVLLQSTVWKKVRPILQQQAWIWSSLALCWYLAP